MAKVTIVNKSVVPLFKLKPGGSMQIDVDENGIPLDMHWRRRLRDAKSDGCVEIVKEQKKEKKINKKEEVKD